MANGEYNDMLPSIAGGLIGISEEKVNTMLATADVDFGDALFAYDGEGKVNKLYHDTVDITLDAILIASNVFTVTINGVVNAVTYASSHDDTMDAMVAAIEADFPTAVVTLTDTGTNLVIRVSITNTELVVSAAVTLGATQAGVTVPLTTIQKYNGMCLRTAKYPNADNQGLYLAGDDVNVMRQGGIWSEVGATVKSGEKAYVDMTVGANFRKLTNVVTDNIGPVGKFISNGDDGDLVQLEVDWLNV